MSDNSQDDEELASLPGSTSGQLGSSMSYVSRAMPSQSSSDESLEAYQEKVSNLMRLIQTLNNQLNSEKIRNRGIDAITKALQEERNKIKILTEENKALQEKLAKADRADTMSLESLEKERQSLKNQLKYLSFDPSKMDELLKERHLLHSKLDSLAEELSTEKLNNVELKRIIAMSPDDKQREISKLHGQLEDAKKQSTMNDLLCKSLTDQIHVLQERLHETNESCQQLLHQLEKQNGEPRQEQLRMLAGGAAASPTQQVLPTHMISSSPTLEDDFAMLQEKIKKLEAQEAELFQANKQWQEYHTRREADYRQSQDVLMKYENDLRQSRVEAQQLRQQVDELRKMLSERSAELSEQQQEKIDHLILQYKRQLSGMEGEKETLLDENRELRLKLNRAKAMCRELEDRVNNKADPSGGHVNSEVVQLLQLQIKTYKEDFEQERSERQRALLQVRELEKQIKLHKAHIASLERERLSRGRSHHHGAGYQIQCDDIDVDSVEMPKPSLPPTVALIGRNVSDDSKGYDEVDSMDEVPKDKTPAPLQCPECHTEFAKSDHVKLLDHMNKCLQ